MHLCEGGGGDCVSVCVHGGVGGGVGVCREGRVCVCLCVCGNITLYWMAT